MEPNADFPEAPESKHEAKPEAKSDAKSAGAANENQTGGLTSDEARRL